jgi:hypothetical protein
VVLEGPNDKREILRVKEYLERSGLFSHLLLDGSIDRQFLAAPEVSDSFYFALLLTKRPQQRRKASDLIRALSFGPVEEEDYWPISERKRKGVTCLLYDDNNQVLYEGYGVTFLDEGLKRTIAEISSEESATSVEKIIGPMLGENKGKNHSLHYFLYLNNALTPSILAMLAPIKNLSLILDNFTLFQSVSVDPKSGSKRDERLPSITLFHSVTIEGVYWRREGSVSESELATMLAPLKSKAVSVHNLFRESPNEIRIRP